MAATWAGVAEGTPRRVGRPARIKPIKGSWISIWWDDRRHFYWNEACLSYSARQWELAVKEVADIGMEYLVLLAIAKDSKAFYNTPLLPKLKLACEDPIGALLKAADKCGVKFFISSDWYGPWDYQCLRDPARVRARFQMMGEVARQYGHHRSFYGWYWPNEAALGPYFTDEFIAYVNECGAEGRKLMPKAKTLIAPYGTNRAVCDDQFVRQLERLEVDIIAYQDEVGCLRMTAAQSAGAFEKLRRAHDRVPQRTLWADVETFAWEGPPNQQSSPLIPAPFPRLKEQLAAVSPFVDKILIYQYQGLMNKPGSKAFAGHPDSTRLYADYVRWQEANSPRVLHSPKARD
ncbi:MAG TPA: DUF4434 domain-containing protein [Candidatus Paceibacterota bacterium]|nr:DUF4434 domain-containing protein [Verrucomicrobiota bacterium]HSA10918.1 DUF4434 domain-containing protein [Candidatus Paceibacterota bacterium]